MAPRVRAKSALAREIDETEALLSQQRSQAANKARKSTPAPPAPLSQETQTAAVALGLLSRGRPTEIVDSEEIALGIVPSDEDEPTASEDSDDLNRDFLEGVEAIPPPSAQPDAPASASPISHRPRVKPVVKPTVKPVVKPSKFTNLTAQIVGEATRRKSKPVTGGRARDRAVPTIQSMEDEDSDSDGPIDFGSGPEPILLVTTINLKILKRKHSRSRSRSRSRERGYAQQQGFPQFMYPPFMGPQFGYPGAYAAPGPLPPIQAIPSSPIRAPPDKASAVDEFISWLQERGDSLQMRSTLRAQFWIKTS